MLEKGRNALRITTLAFDDELTDLIEAAKVDLNIAGVEFDDDNIPAIVSTAIITYCKLHWGTYSDKEGRLKASYDEQKAQLSMAAGYRYWDWEG